MNLSSLTKRSIVQRYNIRIKEIFYVTLGDKTSKDQRKQMVVYTTSDPNFEADIKNLLETVNLKQFEAIFIKRNKSAKPSLAEILLSFDRDLGIIYDQLLEFAKQMNSTASMFKSNKRDKFMGKCFSYFAYFSRYMPVETKQKFIDLEPKNPNFETWLAGCVVLLVPGWLAG